MDSSYPYDPAGGPAVPDIPPISIGALAVGLCDLLRQADGLVFPRTVAIAEHEQRYLLVFAPVLDSAKVITSWAQRFGGVLETHACEPIPGRPYTHITLTFEFCGVSADAYTFIPGTGQEARS
jgi:hypothetical protein